MNEEKNVVIADDLLAAVAEIARAEDKTPDQVIEEATKRYLARERFEKFVLRNERRARELGISETDVPRLVDESPQERRKVE